MNDYYVYIHRLVSSGIVFYVGKGNERSKRAYRKERSKSWKNLVQNQEFSIEFIRKNLSEHEALTLEESLIKNPPDDWKLVNCQLPVKIKKIPIDICNYVYYDETSKSCLRWKVDIGFKIKANSEIGSLTSFGHWSMEFKGVAYQVHRVVMHLHNKLIENMIVNHVNNNPSDNRLSNLEMVTFTENNRKSKHHNNNTVRRNNSSGVNGISEVCQREKYFYAVVEWYDSLGVKRSKKFSYLKLGKEQAWSLAKEFRLKMISELTK